MAPAKVLRLGIEVDDQGSVRTLEQVERGFQQAERASLNYGKTLKDLDAGGRTAVISTKEMNAVLGQTTSTTGLLTSAVGRYVSGAVVGYAIKSTLDWGDSLSALATRSGWSADGLQRMEAVAGANRTTLDAVIASSDQLSVRLTSGDSSVAGALERVNLSFEHLAALNPEERFLAVLSAVGRVSDPLEQARVKADLFGRSWQSIGALFNTDVPAAMAKAHAADKELIESLAKADNAIQTLTRSGKILIAEFLEPFLPLMTAAAERDVPAFVEGIEDLHLKLSTLGAVDLPEIKRWLDAIMDTATQNKFHTDWAGMWMTLEAGAAELPKVKDHILGVGEAFKVPKLNAGELLKIEQELNKESAALDAAWQRARDDFFGDSVLREAEQDLQYITNLHDLVKLSPAAFTGFQKELQDAKARLDVLGDSASASADKIRTTLAAMQALRNVPAEGGPMLAPGAVMSGLGRPLDATGEAAALWPAAYQQSLEELFRQQQEFDRENEAFISNLATEVPSAAAAAGGAMRGFGTDIDGVTARAATAAQTFTLMGSAGRSALEAARQSLSDAEANFRAGVIGADVLGKTRQTAMNAGVFSHAFYVGGGYVDRARRWSYFGAGGPARGSDVVPSMLTPGEGVLSRTGMAALDRLNSGRGVGGASVVLNKGAIVVNASTGQNPEAIAVAVEQKFLQLTSGFMPGRV